MSHDWGYKITNGPNTWVNLFPIAAGNQQSPIDILTSSAQYDPKLQDKDPLTPTYVEEKNLKLTNTGHSVSASIKEKSVLTGGPLTGTYRLEQFHLHWGHKDSHGSEHTINGKSFAAELHLVHWNSDKYESFAKAADKSDGLAVIGVMIKPGKENDAFRIISENVKVVTKSKAENTFPEPYNPCKLLPGNITDYWTYAGSLTTPPLYQSVQWIVMRESIEFSKDQLESLRDLKNADGDHMVDNYRPPVSSHGRKVFSSFSDK